MKTKLSLRVPLSFCALGSGVLLALLSPHSGALFPVFGLWFDAVLFVGVLWCARRAGVRWQRFDWAVLAAVYLGAVLYTAWALGRRTFIYDWDYANYLLRQYDAEAAFAQNALVGFRYLYSTLTEDYNSFLCLFVEFPFCFTSRTGDAYAASMLVSVFPSLLAALAALLKKASEALDVQNQNAYFVIGLTWAVTYPFLRMSALLGQPDWLGLVFGLVIMLLTLDYRFAQLDVPRCAALFLATAALILTRRWYLYFVVGWYACYAVLVAAGSVRLARAGQTRAALVRVRNLAAFGAVSVAAMLALLWPMIRHILQYSYSSHYIYYNVGGFALEVYQQLLHLGAMNLVLMGAGLWYAARQKRLCAPLLGLCQLTLSMLLFTRVQNTGSHQTLLFVPGYFLLFWAGCAWLADTLAHRRALKLGFWLVTVAVALSVRCSRLTIVALPEPVMYLLTYVWDYAAEFVPLDTLTYDRKDIDQIRALSDWIDQNCAEGETAYLVPHDRLYNSDMFKNCDLPRRRLTDKLYFGFSILGTHSFPTGYFDAKYVITAEPFPQTYVTAGELSKKLNDFFLSEQSDYFAYETSFDMGNGTVFTVWRRTVPATRAEAEAALAVFAEEDAQFPEMFSGVIDAWLAQHGL